MGVYHQTSGWEIIVANASIAKNLPIVEVYVVAVDDQDEAKGRILSVIGESGVIKEMTRIASAHMQPYRLLPGQWLRVPTIR